MNIFTECLREPKTPEQRSIMITEFVQEIYNLPDPLQSQMMDWLVEACEETTE
jgi:hypothetical protein